MSTLKYILGGFQGDPGPTGHQGKLWKVCELLLPLPDKVEASSGLEQPAEL